MLIHVQRQVMYSAGVKMDFLMCMLSCERVYEQEISFFPKIRSFFEGKTL